MTPPPAATGRPHTALDLIANCIARLRITDPTDTVAVLLASWHGFSTAEAAGGLLAQDNPDDAVLARNAQPVFAAVALHLRRAPSLAYTYRCVAAADALTPPDHRSEEHSISADRPDETAGRSPAARVRRGILALALELNTLLPKAAEHARMAADRTACRHGARLAHDYPD
jgi:hypothetical protein